uniref:calcium-binding protein n=1 Tax=Acinetobacter piscicola TaxID=2006115 RepID=UPI00142DE5BE
MAKIGDVNKNSNEYFEIFRDAEFSDLDDAVSFLNNMWSSINNIKGSNEIEAQTSLLLLVTDFIGMVSKKANILNQGLQFEEVFRRILRNSETLSKQIDLTKNPTGLVDKVVVVDLVTDITFISGLITSVLKWNPVGTGLNVISLFFGAVSNNMGSGYIQNEKIHRDDILNFIGRSAIDVISKWSEVVAPITSTLLSFMPDDLNPWSEITIDLIGNGIDNNIVGDEGRKYNIWGHEGNDTLKGGKFNDYIDGGVGDDSLYGGAGNDVLIGSDGSDELYGGGNDDVLIVSKFEFGKSTEINVNNLDQVANKAFGGSGSDTIYGGNGDDELYAGDETNDQNDAGTTNKVYGLGGNDELVGGAGTDFLYGGQGEDRLYGGDGGDNLYLAHDSSPDKIALDTSNNFAEGGAGNDTIHGSDGSDGRDIIFTAEDGKGSIDEGTTNYAWGYKGNDILKGGNGKDFIYGGEDKDYLHGGIGDDKLYGGENGDFLYGEEGNDELYAGRNKDDPLDTENNFLYGGQGDDKLFGGKGYDILEGGEGFDTYKAYYKTLVKDEDGSGILYYNNKNLLGAEMRYKSESLSPPPTLDFSSKGYDINNKSTEGGRLSKIAEGKNWVRYIVLGDINFKYKELTTEDLDTRSKTDTDLGVRFYVTVYKDNAEPPPPIYPKPQPPLTPPPTPPTKYDPLVLDLNHDGKISTTPLGTDIYFDLDGNSFAEKTSWVQATDGFVALDLNENGKIDNGKELFGTDTILPDGSKASDGFKALEQYDLNKDGLINGSDIIFQKLKIWKDTNQDGISQSNELFSLSNLGITSISLNNQLINATDDNNVIHTNKGSFTQTVTENGATQIKSGLAETLLFEVNTSETIWQNPNETSENIDIDISELPDFPGYGSATSLHNAMQLDLTGKLKELVSSFAETSSDQQILLAHQILYFWTNNKISTATNVANISSHEKFEIVKVLYGKELEWKNWNPGNVNDLDGYFQKILSSAYVQLLSQTVKQDWMDLIVFQEERLYEATDPFPLTPPTGQGGAHIHSDPKIYATTWDSLKPSKQYVNIFDPSQTREVNWILKNTIWHGDFSQAIKGLTNLFFMDYEVGKNEIEQFQFIVKELDPNSPILYKELIDQFTLSAQSIQDENIRDLLLESIFVLDDSIKGSEENDQIKSWAGDDSISSLGGEDIIYAGNGDDRVYAGDGADIIYGGDDNDNLLGEKGDDLLSGDLGGDILYGGEGNDILNGGLDDDVLDGGSGSDVYKFSLGDGKDIIRSADYGTEKLDKVLFNEGISPENVTLLRDGNSLIIKYSDSDQIKVENYFDANGVTIYKIDQIIFADQTIWDVDYIKNQVLVPSDSVDIIQGYSSNDQLSGLAGDDKIYGNAGNDTLIGGSGNDYLDGGSGDDSYIFSLGDGEDTIRSADYDTHKLDKVLFNEGISPENVVLLRDGNSLIIKYSDSDQIKVENYFDANGVTIYKIDQIIFADQTVWDVDYIKNQVLVPSDSVDIIQGYSSNDQLSGLAGDDKIYGNAGNDTLIGGSGNDYLDGGSGDDSYIFSLGDGEDTIRSADYDTHKLDKVLFNEGISPENVVLLRDGNSLIIKYSDSDQIKVENYFDANGVTIYKIDQIIFADQTVWDVDYIKNQVLVPSDSVDIIQGYSTDDQLSGLAGDDKIYANAGNDTLTGGIGNDYLDGGSGSDTYTFSLGDGEDTIRSADYNIYKLDTVSFNEGIIPENVSLLRVENNLIIKYSDNDQIKVENYFDTNGVTIYKIDQIIFADQTVWDVDYIKNQVLVPSDSVDIIQGYSSNDQLSGLAGDDKIYGNVGNDTITGGLGNDLLEGGSGNDTYLFGPNFGHDIIDNYDYSANRQDIIQFTDSLVQSDFTYRRDNDDLIVKTLDSQNSITVRNYFYSDAAGNHQINQIKFSDNTVLNVEAVKALVLIGTDASETFQSYAIGNEILAGAGDDVLYGKTGNDTFYGGDGLDTLYGGSGSDILNGNEGNDQLNGGEDHDQLTGGSGEDSLNGGSGNDTYLFAPNFGHDIIDNYDYSANRQDVIQFTDGLVQSDFTYRRDNNHLIIKTLNGENSITVRYYFNDDATGHYRIDQIKFSDNTVLDVEAVKALVLTGTDASEIFQAYAVGSEISAGAGDDILYGEVGNDTFYGGDGLDKLYGGSGDDRLEGGNEADQLYGSAGNDLIKGDAGNDYLEGGEGDDQLDGGSGDDSLNGGSGNDIYLFASNFGHDVIDNYEYSANRQDVIQFTDGWCIKKYA